MRIVPQQMKYSLYIFALIALTPSAAITQHIVINEVASSNQNFLDEDGDTPDWIELYNASGEVVNLEGYTIFDPGTSEDRWEFPSVSMTPGEHLLLYASDKDRRDVPLFWHTTIKWGDKWKYHVPHQELPADWNTTAFDDTNWLQGPSGFGYADDDDNTVLEGAVSVFIRTTFHIDQLSEMEAILLHMDYDDGFVAYINGVEIARANFISAGPPAFDAFAEESDREAVMYNGGNAEAFPIDGTNMLMEGTNVLAIQVHNVSSTSSDLTAIPFLSIGYTSFNENYQYSEHLNSVPSNLHVNFKLSGEGDRIFVYDTQNQFIDSLVVPPLIADVSYGRKPDGSESWVYFQKSTPDGSNVTESFESFSDPVTFSVEGGFYGEPFQLTLSAAGENPIYFSTDGSDPLVSDETYDAPITINKTTVIRAVTQSANSISRFPQTETYLLNTNHQLPVVSVTTDPYNLWDFNEGIYVMGPNAEDALPHNGANFWQDWEKPAHVEMYEPDGELAFAENAGIKIFGAWSRAHAQKSLAIYFRDGYGNDEIKYQIFPDKKLDEFRHLVLRNSGNDWNNTMFRDALITSLFHEDIDKQAFRPAVIYLNGEYWGIQNIREKVNEDFLAKNHDLDPDEITILENNAMLVEGDPSHYRAMIDFITSNDLADSENYAYVKTQMEVDNFIQYEIGNIYADNKDWPGNNIKFWRDNNGGKWRWIAYDADFGFDIWNERFVSFNTVNFVMEPYGPDWPNPPWSTLLLRNLLKNEVFKLRFINAFADCLNTALLPESVIGKIDEMSGQTGSEINAHMDRWEGSMNYWNSQVQNMKSFATDRPGYVREHLRSQFQLGPDVELTLEMNDEAFGDILLNTIEPDDFPWSGIYFQNAPVTLTALPKPGYRFLRWEGDLSSTEETVTVSITSATTIKAIFESSDPTLHSIIINEINHDSDKDFDTKDWIELYNKGEEAIDISGWYLTDSDANHVFTFGTGSIIPMDGYLVVCGSVEAFASLQAAVDSITGDLGFGLSGSGDCVKVFTPDGILTDEVCFTGTTPWPQGANGTGATLALKEPYLDNEDPGNWFTDYDYGSPGEVNVYTELGIDPAVDELSIYPNPFHDLLTVRYNLNQRQNLRISVYHTDGRLLKILWEGFSERGAHQVQWVQEQDLEPGIYLLRMEIANGTGTSELLIKRD